MKILASNKKAYFNYEILEAFIAGMKLEGREIKSLRNQKPSFSGSYISLLHGKPMLQELNIPRYRYDSAPEYNPKRKRLLLLKKSEIERIESKLASEGVTVVPLEILLDRQWAKVKIGIVRGKKKYEKREKIKEREVKRKLQKIMKSHS